jgi:hypothetical protein
LHWQFMHSWWLTAWLTAGGGPSGSGHEDGRKFHRRHAEKFEGVLYCLSPFLALRV